MIITTSGRAAAVTPMPPFQSSPRCRPPPPAAHLTCIVVVSHINPNLRDLGLISERRSRTVPSLSHHSRSLFHTIIK